MNEMRLYNWPTQNTAVQWIINSLAPGPRGRRCAQTARGVETPDDCIAPRGHRPDTTRPWKALDHRACRCSVRRRSECGREVSSLAALASIAASSLRRADVCHIHIHTGTQSIFVLLENVGAMS